ncbi:hypothetical protein D3C71_1735100 [compost metagenome]
MTEVTWEPIGPRQKADHLHWFDTRRPRIDRISADIADNLCTQAKDMPLFIEGELCDHALIKGLARGKQILQAIACPLHRLTQMPSQRADQHFFLVERSFSSESSTYVRCDNSETVTRHVQ